MIHSDGTLAHPRGPSIPSPRRCGWFSHISSLPRRCSCRSFSAHPAASPRLHDLVLAHELWMECPQSSGWPAARSRASPRPALWTALRESPSAAGSYSRDSLTDMFISTRPIWASPGGYIAWTARVQAELPPRRPSSGRFPSPWRGTIAASSSTTPRAGRPRSARMRTWTPR